MSGRSDGEGLTAKGPISTMSSSAILYRSGASSSMTSSGSSAFTLSSTLTFLISPEVMSPRSRNSASLIRCCGKGDAQTANFK